jgi:tetratricopeptide (TPR) repeat protein
MAPSGQRRPAQRRPDKRRPQQRRPARDGADPAETPTTASAPTVPDDISWLDLDRQARAALRSLPKEMAERVGGHLAAAGVAIDDDPELARRHTDVARRMAGRVAVVREACALTAYACGDFDSALTEFRAYRRLSGDQSHLPLMADCERGLGRPERAIELASSPEAARLLPAVARELRIVVAGARSDLGQPEAASVLLEADTALRAGSSADASVLRLRYAYATTLEALGRSDEAATWFEAVASADTAGITDAADRVRHDAG